MFRPDRYILNKWARPIATRYMQDFLARDLVFAQNFAASLDSARFINDQMVAVPVFKDQFELLRVSLNTITVIGLYCEFGVFKGDSINFIATHCPDEQIHGFDSFQGLPDNWRAGHDSIGDFKVDTLPEVKDNVQLHPGWFTETLPTFNESHPSPIAFTHIDCDLYSSCKTIFDLLGDKFVPGTVIQFDELIGFPGWQQGEYKAFMEFCASRNLTFEYIGYTREIDRTAQAVAVKLL